MFTHLDHLIVAVDDLEAAAKNYQTLFGMTQVWSGEHKELGTSNALFAFKNTYFELLSATGEGLGADLVNHYLNQSGEGLIGIVFATDDIKKAKSSLEEQGFNMPDISSGEGINSSDQQVRRWKNLFLPPELSRGLFSFIIEHTEGALPSPMAYEPSSPHSLDHVVINTNDADSFIDIYKDAFGIRLALDKTIEHWKKRMLFFRLSKTTIEVIEEQNDQETADTLWGLAWSVASIEETHKRLLGEGIDITPIKKGIKDKTLVATINSHTHNVPTLLIEHLD
ncbi:VOC family protein [Gammaproteobacteria bacterium]|nr:VOC family protein [Gammaproteobacteria bacterium]MDB4194343.1 VOC family protein [Gammaproteobacteria bacterium]MDB9829790.1 VOC family protein [Gammaproteobacteria bacterium]MDB9837821.1 VOC family protein [Gammaproteobacteria bacterium]MDB9854809.1 VOC family protein [Gammaproteobacteria bacterium]